MGVLRIPRAGRRGSGALQADQIATAYGAAEPGRMTLDQAETAGTACESGVLCAFSFDCGFETYGTGTRLPIRFVTSVGKALH